MDSLEEPGPEVRASRPPPDELPEVGEGDRFARVEAEVAQLRQDLAAGKVTAEAVRSRLRDLMVTDAQGRWWSMGYETGQWYCHDGEQWVQRARPPSVTTAAMKGPGARPATREASSTTRLGALVLRLVALCVDLVVLMALDVLISAVLGEYWLLLILVILIANSGYYVVLWWLLGQTPGKMLAGLKIVSTDGSSLTFMEALIRYFGYYVNLIAFGLGFLWILWDERQRGWHDHLANTWVVPSR